MGEATYERLPALLEPIEEELVRTLAPQAGDRCLDLVTGTGAIALRAARAGADVTAIDSTDLIAEKLRRDAEDAGLAVTVDVGNVEYLPYEDACFDVVASNFGLVYAEDHANVAAEVARVTCSGGRLGFTAWRPNPKLGELYRRFTDEPIQGREAYEWGREDHVEDMLGEEFELDFHDGTLWIDAESGEELWELFSRTAAPVASVLRRLDAAQAEEFHRAFVELYEQYRDGDGIRAPRRYLLVVGVRR
ncbi:MAG: methyltransferase domain-containing protein [Actinobacteria bacterium]|nr:methyltransferase domain-containing protein [Actinomycetota bacterium]MBV8395770.1 methyltransferase domain-containing protein [Actinomycetota bacterium]MBV8599812.1 methyltransferase domain-containing protein [Actinomycetota bacterium]